MARYIHIHQETKDENMQELATEVLHVRNNSKKVLKKAIFFGGSSIKDFKKIDGQSGNFQQKFKVYGKQDNKCPKAGCKGILKKIIISNRASFYCLECQK